MSSFKTIVHILEIPSIEYSSTFQYFIECSSAAYESIGQPSIYSSAQYFDPEDTYILAIHFVTFVHSIFVQAYCLYFDIKIGDQDKSWAQYIVCGSC